MLSGSTASAVVQRTLLFRLTLSCVLLFAAIVWEARAGLFPTGRRSATDRTIRPPSGAGSLSTSIRKYLFEIQTLVQGFKVAYLHPRLK
jgi:hypothetical protein